MKLLIAGAFIAGTALTVVIPLGGGTANAQACRKNYYPCSLNAGGRIDPATA
jgi:hypothetical protein